MDYRQPVTQAFSVIGERTVILSDLTCDAYHWPGQTCVRGTDINLIDSLDIPLMAGTYTYKMQLDVISSYGWDPNFQNTARANFDLPSGVVLNSTSGVLFKTATPVPEPRTWALMLGGLALLGAAARRGQCA